MLNKYVPPDFDPSLVPRGKRPKDGLVTVRMMLPFSVQCSTCNTFLYRGRKFNSKKESVSGSEGKYLGIQRFRFYIKCTACSRPITFLTDPKNADYEMESGATRNYEVYKDQAKTNDAAVLDKELEEEEDPMKKLENRVLDSQREMEEMDNLEEIKAMNMRHVQMMSKTKGSGGFDDEAKAVVMAREQKQRAGGEELNENGLTESEEAILKTIKFGKIPSDGVGTANIQRLDEEDEKAFERRRQQEAALLEKQQAELAAKAKTSKPMVPIIKVKRKRVVKQSSSKKTKAEAKKIAAQPTQESDDEGGLVGLLGGYGSDSDSS